MVCPSTWEPSSIANIPHLEPAVPRQFFRRSLRHRSNSPRSQSQRRLQRDSSRSQALRRLWRL
jgi:hypothetical protein